jgi:hypothetical protein
MMRLGSRVYLSVCAAIAAPAAFAQTVPTNLIVSGSTYQDVGQAATLVAGSSLLAPATAGGTNTVATANGQYNDVFLNAGADGSFGVTSQIFLQDFTTGSTIEINPAALVNSFSSKSELAINVSSDGSLLTFMAYNPQVSFSSSGTGGIAAVTTGGANNLGLLDISNSNTPGLIDPTNGVNAQAFRSVGQVSIAALTGAASGSTLSVGSGFTVTNTNAYSGNNGRAVIDLNGQYYMVGNAGNSGKGITGSTEALLAQNTGIQTIAAGSTSPTSTVVGACTGTSGATTGFQCGFNDPTADKSGKDDNFRGLTTMGGNLLVSKGSGGNGVNTVYQASGINNPSTASVSILPGFPTTGTTATPFGLWFANSTTLYVAFEGGDTIAGAGGALSAEGGLSKYSLVGSTWELDYSINSGLGSFSGAAVGADKGTTTFFTDGLRNLTGQVNSNGTVTLYAVTNTLTDSGAGTNWDQGANPDQVVELSDVLADTTAPTGESFTALETSAEGSVFRGVALAPVPLPLSGFLLLSGLGGLFGLSRKRKA